MLPEITVTVVNPIIQLDTQKIDVMRDVIPRLEMSQQFNTEDIAEMFGIKAQDALTVLNALYTFAWITFNDKPDSPEDNKGYRFLGARQPEEMIKIEKTLAISNSHQTMYIPSDKSRVYTTQGWAITEQFKLDPTYGMRIEE